MLQIGEINEKLGGDSYYAFSNSIPNRRKTVSKSVLIGNRFERKVHKFLTYYTGFHGCFSILSTMHFLHQVTEMNPDVIHLHNLHNCYINLPLLFRYLKNQKIPVVWTLHDCWAFTGQCPHFSSIGCNKWKTGCYSCPQYREYPESRVDCTRIMYKLKRKWFTDLSNMTIVTPSQWLANRVGESFLSDYPIRVIPNGLDLSVFKPSTGAFRIRHQCDKKILVLGVSLGWSNKKGLDIFIGLAKLLPDEFQIVLVGITDKQKQEIPDTIIVLNRTSNAEELAEIYTAADYFVNPSKEETMGLVTVEALACGTPVIVSNLTAVPECVTPECGRIVKEYSVEAFMAELLKKPEFVVDKCVEQASKYEKVQKFNKYVALYSSIVK